jgi:nitrite reductase (NADH) large subunit
MEDQMRDTPTKAWICSMCGYIHYGDEPPAECPMCGADRELFDPYFETIAPAALPVVDVTPRRYIILGAGIAGVAAAEALRRGDPAGEITLISNEPGLPYYRMNLTRYLAKEIGPDELVLHPRQWYSDLRVLFLDSMEVNEIDLTGKALVSDGGQYAFDTLILTCGANPFVPPVPGAQRKNVITLRTRADADAILAACQAKADTGQTPRVVCIGGGILGLETAGALACRGAQVTVLENQPWLLPRQLNLPAAKILREYIQGLDITIVTQARTVEICGDEAVTGVRLEGGETSSMPADLVVISAGVRSNVELARKAGLQVNQGIVVDECMQTSHPDVFAAGDVAEFNGVLYGTWAPAQAQGAVAGSSAAGKTSTYSGPPRSNTLKVLGIDLFSIGAVNEPAALLVDKSTDRTYTGFLFQNGRMTGAILLGDATLAAKVKRAVEEKQDFSGLLSGSPEVNKIKEQLIERQ